MWLLVTIGTVDLVLIQEAKQGDKEAYFGAKTLFQIRHRVRMPTIRASGGKGCHLRLWLCPVQSRELS